MADAAETIFEEFQEDGWPMIQELPEQGRQETLHLEFKNKASPRKGEPTKKDREHLSEALSGFANAAGGVVVWGVDAREVDGEDVVQGIRPISDLDVFASRLHSLTPEMVTPAVDGVRHEVVRDPESGEEGIALTLVPQSDRTPHMAIGPNLQHYCRRSGHTFRPMEHYEVADMFGERPQPDLRLSTDWEVKNVSEPERDKPPNGQFNLNVYLANQGRGVAQYAAVAVRHDSAMKLQWSPGGPWPQGTSPITYAHRYAAGPGEVLYPGDRIRLTRLYSRGKIDLDRRLKVELHAAAVGTESVQKAVQISGTEIESAAREKL